MLTKLKQISPVLFITTLIAGVYALHLIEAFYALHIFSLIGIYILIVLGLNLVIGYSGVLDLGFMAFYAIAAYTAALLSAKGVSFWLCLPASILVTCTFRYILGRPIMRLKGDYMAIVTLGFGEITRLILNNFDLLTNGPKGLPRVGEHIGKINFFGIQIIEEYQYFYLILFFIIIAIIGIKLIEKSKYGRAFICIREDETAAEVCGINIVRIKMLAFVLSAGLAATAGTIYTHWIGFISPESFTFWESIMLVAMIVLGGIGNIAGIILGTILLVGGPEVLRYNLGADLVLYRMLIFGVLMVVMVLFRPQGIIPEKRHEWELKDTDKDAT